MAFTVVTEKSAFGNKAVVLMTVTADSAEANIPTGLSLITHMTVGIVSCLTGTALPHIGVNSNSTGVLTPGTLGVSGVNAGDVFHIVCYGR